MKREIAESVERLIEENFRTGTAWKRAHELAQGREGQKHFDWLHAFCHRVEGDEANAAYWYRRAGIDPFSGSFEEEAAALKALDA